MKLFDIKLPKDGICDEQKLYVRCDEYSYDDDGGLVIDGGKTASFDTYFNCFSYGKYKQHTNLQNFFVRLKLKGDVTVRLIRRVENEPIEVVNCLVEEITSKILPKDLAKVKKPDITDEVLYQFNFNDSATGEIEIPVELNTLDGVGYLFIELSSQTGGVFYGGGYYTNDSPEHDVKVGIVICTFKREKYVTANVARINKWLNRDDYYKQRLEVFVIDNGNTLTAEQIAGANLFPNKNLGGSGGFTRGIMEVLKREEFTHFLLMDDDIVFDSNILVKTIGLLRFAKNKDELCVGASMLKLNKPYWQYEMTAVFGGVRLKANHTGYNLCNPIAVLKNEEELEYNYHAWWYMCMPVGKAKENGLPLPFFIKFDDIEYGLRNIKECAALNGLGVLHEDFAGKYSAELEYYNCRNYAVTCSLYEKYGRFKQFKRLLLFTSAQLVFQRYFTMENVFRAYNDFFKGPEFLMSVDGEQLHKDLRSNNPKTYSKEELEEQGFVIEKYKSHKKASLFQVITLNGYLIPTCFYKNGRKSYHVIDLAECPPKYFYKVKTAVQYNFDTQRGFVTKQKRTKLFRAGFQLIKFAFLFLFKYKKVVKCYKKNFKKLTSEESWNNILFG